ncbi:MAG: MarC family protein [Bacteroidia bacterium]|nr:MarC family protein [Bacteroidia bacterium]MBP9689012.1 MarC family protein [Bacteroidia bacterium]
MDFFSLQEIVTITLTLFAMIDILGAIPIILSLRKKIAHIDSGKATIAAGILMVLFLLIGERLLNLFGIDVSSFALAGSIVIFIIAIEMILGIDIFRTDPDEKSGSIIPIAFPIIAGSGTLTTIISLKAVYHIQNIFAGIVVNLIIVFIVLKSTKHIERVLGKSGLALVRKFFGIILLAIAVKLFKANL